MIPKELQERIDSFVDNSEFSYSRQSMYEAARLALEYMGDRWVSVDEGVTRKQELIWYNPNIYLPEVSETSHISDGYYLDGMRVTHTIHNILRLVITAMVKLYVKGLPTIFRMKMK